MGWVTHRRADEFVRLRNHLEKLHPGLIVIFICYFQTVSFNGIDSQIFKENIKRKI